MLRRNVLQLIGGGVVVAAGSVGGFIALNGPSEAAREPWKKAGQYGDFRRRALSYALLAPNPHNRQPWLVRLEGEEALTLYCDLARRLPATDPFDRQITIGCGAFLELLAKAAAQDGYQTIIKAFPEGETMETLDRRPVAHVVFKKGGAAPDPLFAQVLARRSNKEVYEPRDVPAQALAAIAQAGRAFAVSASTIGNTDLAARLRDLTWRAHLKEVTTPVTNQESVDLMRIGAAEVAANPDGIELEGPFFEAGRLVGAVNRKALADPNSAMFREGLAIYQNMAKSARSFGWLINDNRSRADQINAGRAYVCLNLKATALGLGIHPWSQSLQEYAQMADLFREAHDLIGAGRRIQMLFRIGYGPKIGPTPRRGLEAHLV
jgi:hypothetical protein